MSLSLVDFGDGVPVGFGALDGVCFHEGEDGVVLPCEHVLEGVEFLPQLYLKAVSYGVDELERGVVS